MRTRLVLFISICTVAAAIACGGNVGAEAPPSGGVTPTAQVYPTSTPRPHFGPPPVTADSLTATPQATASPTPTVQPSAPLPTPTPDDPPDMLPAAPVEGGELSQPSEPEEPTPTVGPLPPLGDVPVDSGLFEPVVEYDYILPDQWADYVGDDRIVVEHESGNARVTLREIPVNRFAVRNIAEYAATERPEEFADWSLSGQQGIDESAYQFSYSGRNGNVSALAIVEWRIWGEYVIEVTIEAVASEWATDSNLRNTAIVIAASFTPDSQFTTTTSDEVQDRLKVQFGAQSSRIFLQLEPGSAVAQLTCRQVFDELLSEPVYVGSGVWQVYAIGDRGAQVWHLYEPSLAIVAAEHNTSSC